MESLGTQTEILKSVEALWMSSDSIGLREPKKRKTNLLWRRKSASDSWRLVTRYYLEPSTHICLMLCLMDHVFLSLSLFLLRFFFSSSIFFSFQLFSFVFA